MQELGELEKRHEDFAKRNVQIIAISNDDQKEAQATQADFPHLIIVADTEGKLAQAFETIQPGAGHKGEDTNAPTTILVDGDGKVRWLGRLEYFMTRYSPDDVLKAIDEVWPGK